MQVLIITTKPGQCHDAIGRNPANLNTRLVNLVSLTLKYYLFGKVATKLISYQPSSQHCEQLLSDFTSLDSRCYLISWRVALACPMIWGN